MGNLMRSLKSLIRQSRVTAAGSDDKDFPVQQVEYLGKLGDATMWHPYGMSANVPPDFLALIMSVGANPEARVAFPSSPKERTESPLPSPLQSGELLVFNPITKAFVHFREDGSIEMKTPTDLDVTVEGNVNLTVEGNVTVAAEGDIALGAGGDISLTAGGSIAMEAGSAITADSATHQIDTSGLYRVNSIGNIDLVVTTGIVNLGGVGGKNSARKDDDITLSGPDRIQIGSTQVKVIDGIGGPA